MKQVFTVNVDPLPTGSAYRYKVTVYLGKQWIGCRSIDFRFMAGRRARQIVRQSRRDVNRASSTTFTIEA